MNSQSNDMKEMINGVKFIKLEENSMSTFNSFNQTQNSPFNQYHDQGRQLKTEFIVKAENPIQMQSLKEMTIRKPNNRQFVQFNDYFVRIEPEIAPENLLLSINMNRDHNEPEWTLLQLYSTYEILVLGNKMLFGSNTRLAKKQKRARTEIDYFLKGLQFQPKTENMESQCLIHSSIDNSYIRKPSKTEFCYFYAYYNSEFVYTKEILIRDLNMLNMEFKNLERDWTMAEVMATLEILVMGANMAERKRVRLTKEQKRAQMDIKDFIENYPHYMSQ